MDGPTIQARVYAGYAKSAKIIGLPYQQYRPLTALVPLANFVATIKAAFDSSANYSFAKPNEYGDPTWYALLDDASVAPGDYLIGNGEFKYVAGKQFLLPVIVIDCNRSLKVSRFSNPGTVGAVGYGAMQPSTETEILGTAGNFWPASILLGSKSQAAAELPAGVKNGGWIVLLPPSVPIKIITGDIVTDDLGRRYAVEAAELTDLGWRIKTTEVHV